MARGMLSGSFGKELWLHLSRSTTCSSTGQIQMDNFKTLDEARLSVRHHLAVDGSDFNVRRSTKRARLAVQQTLRHPTLLARGAGFPLTPADYQWR